MIRTTETPSSSPIPSRFASRRTALRRGAAAVLAIAPPWPTVATQVEADVPAASLALAALALAAWTYRRRTSAELAVLAGATLAYAASVKLSALTALVPFAALSLLGGDRL